MMTKTTLNYKPDLWDASGMHDTERVINHTVPTDEPQPGQNLKSGLDLDPQ